MSMHEYRPGRWTALVAEGAVALLHPAVPDDVARELWQLASTGRRLGAWVEYLAAAGISTLPSFAMVEAHDAGLRVLVRGDVEVAVGAHVVSGRGYATWREEIVAAAEDVTLRADDDGAADDGAGAGGVAGDAPWLPLVGGIVRVGAVRLAEGAVPEPADELEDDDVEATVARMPALAAAVGASAFAPPAAGAGAASGAGERPDARPGAGVDGVLGAGSGPAVATENEAVATNEAEAVATETEAVEAEAAESEAAESATAHGADLGADTDGTDAAEATVAADVLADAAEEDGESDDDYDHLLWSTEQLDAHAKAAPQPGTGQDDSTGRPEAEGPDGTAGHDGDAPTPGPWSAPSTSAAGLVAGSATADGEGIDLEATRAPEPEPGLESEPGPEPEPVLGSAPGDGSAPGGGSAESAAAPAAPQWQPPPLIDSVPGRLAPPSRAAEQPAAPGVQPARTAEQPAAPVGPPVGPPVNLAPPVPGVTDDGDHDGETILTSELPTAVGPVATDPAPPPVPRVELVLSNGPRIEMDRPVLLGRAPEAARFAGSEAPRLVSVPSPEKDVSATHVEVRPAGGHVVVTDMNSTNGTVVRLPGQPEMRLQPGTGVPVAAGAVVELGVGVTLTVAEIEDAP